MLQTVFNANDSIICFPKKKKSQVCAPEKSSVPYGAQYKYCCPLRLLRQIFNIYIFFLSEYPEKIAFKVTFRKNVSEITFAPGTTCSRLLKVQFVIFKVYFKAAVCNIKNCFRGTVCNVYRGFKEAGSYD